MLQLKDLQCFVSVYEMGGFGRAADVLDTVQSQVSMRIHRLEIAVGAPLFERLHRGIKPTAKGELLYRHAKRVLREVGELESALKGRDAA
jgi:LysR family nitrogen assimilation transcriptional regulator